MSEIKEYLVYKKYSVGSEIYLLSDFVPHVIKEIFVKDDEVYFRVNKTNNINEKPDFTIKERDIFSIKKFNMISVEDSINICNNLVTSNPCSIALTPKNKADIDSFNSIALTPENKADICSFISANPFSDLTLSDSEEKINFKFAIKEIVTDKKFKFNGKTIFKKVPQIKTIVDVARGYHFLRGTATCDKIDYNERDGILNAIANAVCGGNFDKVYAATLKAKEKARLAECKCSMCGGVYNNPEDARSCEKLHIENKKKRSRNHWLKTEAKRRYKKLCEENKIKEYIEQFVKKDSKIK